MAEKAITIGVRIPARWQKKIRAISQVTGQTDSDIYREALGKHLGESDPKAVKGAIASLENRVTSLEQKLAGLGRLVGQ